MYKYSGLNFSKYFLAVQMKDGNPIEKELFKNLS